ncbi:ATP-dependent DNA ligase [Streptomyces chrestomyceticus]|uniref:ATP-dependent DNA ligase n=1 Tax=Streptomyces chrestomyceticus TaxID=68185 RepID=UPI0033D60D02
MPPFPLPADLALARPVDEVRTGPGWNLEAKVDGWRCSVHTGSGRIWSRHGKLLTRAFSDVAEVARELPDCVLDGELLAVTDDGEISFGRLQTRAGRGPKRGADFTVHVAVFDVLAIGDRTDLRPRPYRERRAQLLELLEGGPPQIRPVPATTDLGEALRWVGALGGVEGIVSKPDKPYTAGRAGSGWLKWRRRHTLDVAVLGVTGTTPATQALVLGLPRSRGALRAVGVSLPLPAALRHQLAGLLHPQDGGARSELPGTVGGLPGSPPIFYLPVRPDVVVEIEADQAAPTEWRRFRHRPRVVRVREDLAVDELPVTS